MLTYKNLLIFGPEIQFMNILARVYTFLIMCWLGKN